MAIGLFGGLSTLIFTLRLNLLFGMNDIAFIVFTSVITDTLSPAFSTMPLLVLYAKITPHHIEATVFAFITGVNNFSMTVLSPMMGAFIND
jgi:hypothetical protein